MILFFFGIFPNWRYIRNIAVWEYFDRIEIYYYYAADKFSDYERIKDIGFFGS